jgi:hypothetical protein
MGVVARETNKRELEDNQSINQSITKKCLRSEQGMMKSRGKVKFVFVFVCVVCMGELNELTPLVVSFHTQYQAICDSRLFCPFRRF